MASEACKDFKNQPTALEYERAGEIIAFFSKRDTGLSEYENNVRRCIINEYSYFEHLPLVASAWAALERSKQPDAASKQRACWPG